MASITNLENFGSDEHFTPEWVFKALNVQFDLDVASSKLNTFVSAKRKYTIDDDGLNSDWFGLVWCNPPYSKPTEWINKFIEHNNGIALIPVTRGRWFDSVWNSKGVIVICPYNFKFERPDGVKRDITFRTVFWALGDGIKILKNSGLGNWR